MSKNTIHTLVTLMIAALLSSCANAGVIGILSADSGLSLASGEAPLVEMSGEQDFPPDHLLSRSGQSMAPIGLLDGIANVHWIHICQSCSLPDQACTARQRLIAWRGYLDDFPFTLLKVPILASP